MSRFHAIGVQEGVSKVTGFREYDDVALVGTLVIIQEHVKILLLYNL
jgi:hypothetical protein